MTEVRSDADQARSSAFGIAALALGAILAGVLVATVNHPVTEVGAFGPEETGNQALYVAGLALSGLGSLLLTVVTVAYGVALGNRMSRD
jgi:hypothetical protein